MREEGTEEEVRERDPAEEERRWEGRGTFGRERNEVLPEVEAGLERGRREEEQVRGVFSSGVFSSGVFLSGVFSSRVLSSVGRREESRTADCCSQVASAPLRGGPLRSSHGRSGQKTAERNAEKRTIAA